LAQIRATLSIRAVSATSVGYAKDAPVHRAPICPCGQMLVPVHAAGGRNQVRQTAQTSQVRAAVPRPCETSGHSDPRTHRDGIVHPFVRLTSSLSWRPVMLTKAPSSTNRLAVCDALGSVFASRKPMTVS